MRAVLLLAAAVAAIAATNVARSAAAPSVWTVEHYLTSETWHAYADVGSNHGPDGIYAAQQDLRSTDGRKVGVVNGYGVNLHPPYVFFHWTATLRGGTLTIESAISLRSKTTVYPIEGGTGCFVGALGTVTLTDAGSKGSLVTVRYRR